MGDRRYSRDHEWIEADGDVATIGISDHAQDRLGDVVFVELPEIGRAVARNEEICVVESVKAASEVYAPVAGEVVEINAALAEDPALANADPHGAGWFLRLRVDDPAQLADLMDEEAYRAYLAELE